MASRSKKRRRRLLKYAAYTAGALGAAYLGTKIFGGSGTDAPGGEDAGYSDASEGGGEGAMTGPTVQAGMLGGIPTPVLLGGAALILLLFWKK